jgi:glucose/arabinose dehydrogenase
MRLLAGLLAFALLVPAAKAEVGERIHLRPGDLPAPNATPSAANSPRAVARPANAAPTVPPGFRVTLFAEKIVRPRHLVVASNGDVLLAQPGEGQITLLRDADGDGRAELRQPFLRDLQRPHGIAIHGEHVYVGDTRGVWRAPYRAGDLTPRGPVEAVTAEGAIGSGSGHSTRNVAVSPDGTRLFVSIGSAGNIGEERSPRATIQSFRIGGPSALAREQTTFASGLRNPIGIAFYPGTDRLFTVVNERDGLGDELVPDYLTEVLEGGFYGWPYSYIGSRPQPGFAERRPDLVAQSRVPDVLFRSHSAPISLVFYQGSQFPAEYRGDAFVTLRGSWNADRPRGYQVARVKFTGGKPEGGYEIFMDGFRLDAKGGQGKAEVWGRPAGIAETPDGSLLVTDDTGDTIWKVSWVGR